MQVYEQMSKGARAELYEGERVLIYEGYLTKLITGAPLKLPIPYYTDIMKVLQGMGCVRQIKRGGGTAMSQWALYKRPDEDNYKLYLSSKTPDRRTSKTALVEQRVNDLAERVSTLEDAFQEWLEAQNTPEG